MERGTCWLLMLLMSVSLSCNKADSDALRIAAAANMQFAIDALTAEFMVSTGTHCEVIISSSGKLTAQITQGAPYDIFLSADMKYPKQLIKAGKALDPVIVYAEGQLILWTLRSDLLIDSTQNAADLLRASKISHIALANPKTAPYGRAALEVLNHYKLFDEVEEKLVFGESIAQTNQFVTTQAAELGFTTKSVVFAPHLKDRGRWIELPDSIYQSIQQGAVLLQNDTPHPKAEEFMKFLQSPAAKKILNNFGYRTS